MYALLKTYKSSLLFLFLSQCTRQLLSHAFKEGHVRCALSPAIAPAAHCRRRSSPPCAVVFARRCRARSLLSFAVATVNVAVLYRHLRACLALWCAVGVALAIPRHGCG